MGEVYRARDTKLNREVALKVLPTAMANDAERMARFQREAQVLASLNHPNIASIYGLEESGGVLALVMELVEGPTLADRLKAGAIPLEEALPTARQIAEALEAAHEKNITHRDLKPANVKVTPDGMVKVLDFGLAKAAEDTAASGDPSNSPTISAAATQAGMIMGTAAYMSPEQARGKPVDKRADIWAFGVVLYEMLTGRRLFEGESVAETLGLLFTREPDLAALPAPTPASIRALIERCLVKDPRQRLRDIGEARWQIDDVLGGRGAPTLLALQRRRPWGFWLAVPLIAIAAATVGWLAKPAPPVPLVRLSIALPPGEQVTTVPAISRDGHVVAYAAGRTVATSQLYIRTLDDFAARTVVGSTAAQHPFFSPEGRFVAFFADGKLRRAAVTGGAATDIAPAPNAWGGTWGADGRIVYVPNFSAGLWRVSAEGGFPEQLTKPDGALAGYAHVFPQHVAGSEDVLFGYWGQAFYTALLSVKTGAWREITPAAKTESLFTGTYAASGHVLAGDVGGGVRAGEWNPATKTPVSPETLVLDNVYWSLGIERPWFNISDNGTAVYVPGNPSNRHLVWVDRQGQVSQLPGGAEQILRATVSRDGRRVVYDDGNRTQWVVDLATGARTRIVSDVRSWTGGWLPGDERIVVSSNKSGDWDLYTVGTGGSVELQPLLKKPFAQFAEAVAPDGSVVYMEDHPVTGQDLWTLSPDGHTSPLVVTPFNENEASVSPDGRFVAYISDESGRNEVYAIPASGKGQRVAISLEGGTGPVWSRDGRELFYRAGDNLMSVQVRTRGDLVLGARRKLLDLSGYDSGLFHEFDVSSDGQRFLLIRSDPASRPVRLDIILNWFNELRRKVRAQ
jgi:dipeptidyl aminopeptidase/acylaminoacyl peptidase